MMNAYRNIGVLLPVRYAVRERERERELAAKSTKRRGRRSWHERWW